MVVVVDNEPKVIFKLTKRLVLREFGAFWNDFCRLHG